MIGRHREPLALAAVLAGLVLLARGPGLALAGAGAALALAGAILCPRAGLAGVVATLPFYLFARDLGGQSVGPTEAAILLTALAVAARRLAWAAGGLAWAPVRRRENGGTAPLRVFDAEGKVGTEPRAAWDAFDAPIALFLAAALLSLLATEYLRLSLRELRTLIVEPVLFWYLCRAVLRSPGDVARLVLALAAVTTVVAVVALLQAVAGGAVTEVQGVRRVQGTYTSPNHLALLLGRALPLLTAAALLLPRWRLLAAVGAMLCAGALVATFSVGGWLGAGLGVLVVMGLVGGWRPVAALVAVGALAGAVLFTAAPVERLRGRLDPTQGTGLVRVQLWRASVELIGESPVLGIGLDNFLYRYPARMPPGAAFEPNLSHPHNLVLQTWLQLGLAGLAAVGWLLALAVRRLWCAARRPPPVTDGTAGSRPASPSLDPLTGSAVERALAVGALGSLADFVAHGMVDNSYFLPDLAVVFWLTLAVAATARAPSAQATASG